MDLSGCLTGCSNRGKCPLDTNTKSILCECEMFFTGSSCQIDLRSCSANPCMHSGLCVDLLASAGAQPQSYNCSCASGFSGRNCETQNDLCQSDSCSSHGSCVSKGNVTECHCFADYSGEKCENEKNNFKKMRQSIAFSSLALLLAAILTLVSLIVISDVLTMLGVTKKKRARLVKRKIMITKFKYYN